LILMWGPTVRRVLAGYYLYMYTFFGSIFMLVGILSIYIECGTVNLLILQTYSFSYFKQLFLWLLFFIGFAIKIPMFPFHIWLPEAHVEAPTEGSVLLAGLLLKLGGYGFIRVLLNLFPFACVYFLPVVFTFASIGVWYSSLIAVRQVDLKKLVAYTSIAHMNYLVLGIFSTSIYGLVGSVLLMLAHGFVSSGLFSCIGLLYDRYQTRQLDYYGGLYLGMPIFSVYFFIFSISNFGFPLTLNFVGELLILLGLVKLNFFIIFFSTVGLFVSIIYSMWSYSRTMFGNLKPFIICGLKDLSLSEFHSLFLLAFSTLFFWLVSEFYNRCFIH